MSTCRLFVTEQRFLPSAEIHPSGQRVSGAGITLRYCAHPTGPLPRHIAQTVLGGGRSLLTCEGDLARCQVPEGMR